MSGNWPKGKVEEGSKDAAGARSLGGCAIVFFILIGALVYLPIFAAVAGFSWRLFLYTCGC